MRENNRKDNIEIIDNIAYNLQTWNRLNDRAYHQCKLLGDKYCHTIYYEQLVNNPEPPLRKLMGFLRLNWIDQILHHDNFLNENKISISTDPLYKNFPRSKISNSSIGKWKGKVHVLEDAKFLNKYGPMLKTLNYIV